MPSKMEATAAVSTGTAVSSMERNASDQLDDLTFQASQGNYLLPNGNMETESNRLDIAHRMWYLTLDGELHRAPLDPENPPKRVLDVATGNGNWAIDFAKKYPSSDVLGFDISEVQAQNVPSNCRFMVANAEDDWDFESTPFDYIHMRSTATCFKTPLTIMQKAHAALTPGGYLEMHDINLQTSDEPPTGNALEELIDLIIEATTKAGAPQWNMQPQYPGWLTEAGFTNVTEKVFRWPTNPDWPETDKEKALGAWFLEQMEAGRLLEAVSTRICLQMLGWSKERFEEFMVRTKEAWRDGKNRRYSPIHVVYGQKPVTDV